MFIHSLHQSLIHNLTFSVTQYLYKVNFLLMKQYFIYKYEYKDIYIYIYIDT